jgi:hypothetical protein
MNTDDEEALALEAVIRQQPVKTEQTVKTEYVVVNCRVHELVISL